MIICLHKRKLDLGYTGLSVPFFQHFYKSEFVLRQNFKIYIYIYLTVLDLSCDKQDLVP